MKRFLAAIALMLTVFGAHPALAQQAAPTTSEEIRATITNLERVYEDEGIPQAEFLATDESGAVYRVDTANSYQEGLRYKLKEGDRVVLQLYQDADGSTQAYFVDIVRTSSLIWIAVLFAVLILAVGWFRGFSALIGLAITLLVLFGFILPSILAGRDPVVFTALGCVVILGVNMHLSHGFSKRTTAAFGATVIGLGLAVIFGKLLVGFAHLSGLASEEATFFYWQTMGLQAPPGILLVGILLGATGVLDDIAITQSETVAELRQANPALDSKDLFVRGMRVGRHHIASTVNTLVLAYAGVALPLFLLFLSEPSVSFASFLNTEAVAEEIVRTVAGTSALVLTVPIATWVAAVLPAKPHVHKSA